MRHITNDHQLPLISVVLPVLNAARYLPEALDSILAQTYTNLEIIAIDDASTDESLAILRHYARSDKRIKILKNTKTLKISLTLNRGLSHAKGKYIARMDADDIAHPKRLEKQISYLLKHPKTVIVGSQCHTIDIKGRLIGRKKFPLSHTEIKNGLFTGNPIQHPTAVINKSLLPNNFSWYDPDLPPAEDLDLFFRLGKYGRYANLPDYLFKYRQHQGSETFKNPLHTFSQTQRVRQLAVSVYNYKPTLKAKIGNQLQLITLALLPESLIYPTYLLIRGIKSPFQFSRPLSRIKKGLVQAFS